MIKQIVDVGISRLNPFVVVSETNVTLRGQIQLHNRLPFFVSSENNKDLNRVARLPNYAYYPLTAPVELIYSYTNDEQTNPEEPPKEEIKIIRLQDQELVIEIKNPCIVRSIYRQLDLDTTAIYKYVDQFPDPSKPRLIPFRDLRTHQLYTIENTIRAAQIISQQQELTTLSCLFDLPKYKNYRVISLIDQALSDWLGLTYSEYLYFSYTRTTPRISWLNLTYSEYQYTTYNQFLDIEL
jgi:hypothetical protein